MEQNFNIRSHISCLPCKMAESLQNIFTTLMSCRAVRGVARNFMKMKPANKNKKVREKSREYHNHKPQPFPDTKRKRKPIKPNKHISEKRTKSTKISSLFPKRGNRNAKRTETHKNKITQG